MAIQHSVLFSVRKRTGAVAGSVITFSSFKVNMKCKRCDEQLPEDSRKRTDHLREHGDELLWLCPFCNHSVTSRRRRDLMIHIQGQHSELEAMEPIAEQRAKAVEKAYPGSFTGSTSVKRTRPQSAPAEREESSSPESSPVVRPVRSRIQRVARRVGKSRERSPPVHPLRRTASPAPPVPSGSQAAEAGSHRSSRRHHRSSRRKSPVHTTGLLPGAGSSLGKGKGQSKSSGRANPTESVQITPAPSSPAAAPSNPVPRKAVKLKILEEESPPPSREQSLDPVRHHSATRTSSPHEVPEREPGGGTEVRGDLSTVQRIRRRKSLTPLRHDQRQVVLQEQEESDVAAEMSVESTPLTPGDQSRRVTMTDVTEYLTTATLAEWSVIRPMMPPVRRMTAGTQAGPPARNHQSRGIQADVPPFFRWTEEGITVQQGPAQFHLRGRYPESAFTGPGPRDPGAAGQSTVRRRPEESGHVVPPTAAAKPPSKS